MIKGRLFELLSQYDFLFFTSLFQWKQDSRSIGFLAEGNQLHSNKL